MPMHDTKPKRKKDKNMEMNNEDWKKHSEYVLEELKRLSRCYESIEKRLTDLTTEVKVEVAKLKVKSGVWGIIGGFLPFMLGLLLFYFRGKL